MYDKTVYSSDYHSVVKDYIYDVDTLKRLRTISLSLNYNIINQNITYEDEVTASGIHASLLISKIEYNINHGYTYSYDYDNKGNITSIKVEEVYEERVVVDRVCEVTPKGVRCHNIYETRLSTRTAENNEYEYDDLNQLVRENSFYNDANLNFTGVYSYDNRGNITSKNYYDYKTLASISTDSLITKLSPNKEYIYSYYTTDWIDRLEYVTIKDNGVTTKTIPINEYDDNGNPKSYDGWTIDYEGRSIVELTRDGKTISNSYNDSGIRTYKKVTTGALNYDEYIYYLDGDMVLSEKINHVVNGTIASTDNIYYTYDVDGTQIRMNYKGKEYFYIRNIQGDVVKIIDITGKVVVTYSYDAWGNIILTKEYNADGTEKSELDIAKVNPYRYRGYRYDEETGWYYLQSRFYNPEIGRFINADGQINGGILGNNLYAYCENNPVMMVDPTGYSGGALALGLGYGLSIGPVGWTIIGVVAVVAVVAIVAVYVSENSTPGGFSFPSIDTTPGGFSSPPIDSAPGGYSSPPIDSTPGGFSTTLPGFTHEVFNGEGISTGYMFSQNDSKRFSPDQQALIELAKMGKKLGVTESEAQILIDWADKLNIPQHGPEVHPNRPGPASNIPHIHIGPVDHITIKFDK